MNKFQNYELKRSTTVIDEYGQQKKNQFDTVKILPIAVFLKQDERLNNNPNFSKVTHIGVYKGSFTDFQKHDRLDAAYVITHLIKGNRKVLLYLEEL